jgi:hypothetical protein
MTIKAIGNIPRNAGLAERGTMADMCWNDPDDTPEEWLMKCWGTR